MNARRNLIPFSPSSPFVFQPFFFPVSLLHLSLSLFVPLISCALSLLLLSYRDKKSQCLFCRTSQKKGSVFSRVQRKSHKITHISSSSSYSSLVFLFVQCTRFHLFFPSLSTSPLQWKEHSQNSTTAQGSTAGTHHHPLLCSPALSARCRWLENSWNERESAVQAPKTQIQAMSTDINK